MKPIIIDVREPDEYAQGHAPDAINIPLKNFEGEVEMLKDTSKDAPIIVYCESGRRSSRAINSLKQQGFTNLTNGINQDEAVKNLE